MYHVSRIGSNVKCIQCILYIYIYIVHYMYMGVRGLKSYSFDNTRSSISRAEGGPSNNGASGANMFRYYQEGGGWQSRSFLAGLLQYCSFSPIILGKSFFPKSRFRLFRY